MDKQYSKIELEFPKFEIIVDDGSILNHKYNMHFLNMSQLIADDLSRDPSTKVGSVITSTDYRQISTGYNGFPRGFPDTIENWRIKENKYKYVIHSELNNLLNCPFDTKGCYLYCTTQPCVECMKALIQAGISRVFFINKYDKIDTEAWDNLAPMFKQVVRYLT